MAITTHSALYLAIVYKWQTNQPEGWNRVRDATNGTQYLLNTNRVDSIVDKTSGQTTRISYYYFDNPLDYRDNSHYIVEGHSVAMLKVHMDVTPTHTHMSLNIFPDMDHSKTAVATVIKIDDFAYGVAVTDAHSATQSYVWYTDSAFKLNRCRVNHSLQDILDLVQP